MRRRIEKLESNISQLLKSQLYAISVASAVRELVQNAVDANANNISVIINFDTQSVMVQDDGSGIHPKDLTLVGRPSHTSKIRQLNDLEHFDTFGFHGNALHSLASVSKLWIVSKVNSYNSSWIKKSSSDAAMLSPEVATAIEDKYNWQPFELDQQGTFVLVEDLFYNIPVRQKMSKMSSDCDTIDQIRADMLHICLFQPDIHLKMSMMKKANDSETIIEHIGSTSKHITPNMLLPKIFREIFGPSIPINCFKKVNLSFKQFSVIGVISKVATTNRMLKFIYINGHEYHDKNYLKSIDTLFQNAGFGLDELTQEYSSKGVKRAIAKYPVLILKVKSPVNYSDYIQNSSKKVFSPTNKTIIDTLILKVLRSFLTLQGYISQDAEVIFEKSININEPSRENKSTNTGKVSKDSLNVLFKSKIVSARIQPIELKGRSKNNAQNLANKSTKFETINSFDLTNSAEFKISNSILPTKQNTLSSTTLNFNQRHNPIDVHNSSFKFNFRSQDLKKCKVISQIDKKFLLLKFSKNQVTESDILLIIDQHACDERIKLESYLREFTQEFLTQSLMKLPIDKLTAKISKLEANHLNDYQKEFYYWGINYAITDDSNLSLCLNIVSLPAILQKRFRGSPDQLKTMLIQHIYDLKDHRKFTMLNTPVFSDNQLFSKSFNWWQYVNYIPTFLKEYFNSKACRSAIMFGDHLTKEECSTMVELLSTCHIPFQCAHGRPSIMPITGLEFENKITQTGSNMLNGYSDDYRIDNFCSQR